MVYSLARMQGNQVQPPFELGGFYSRQGDRHVLTDGELCVELKGPLTETLEPGTAIQVRVIQNLSEQIVFDQITAVYPLARERRSFNLHALKYAEFLNDVRAFFMRRRLKEVLTPTLVRCPGLEPSLEPFAVQVTRGRETTEAYLPTSPEIHLKQALAMGMSDIFALKTCFRRGEFSAHHENEFTMLEWYRAFADLDMIQEDLKALVASLTIKWSGQPIEWTESDFATLFKHVLDFELTPQTQLPELRALCADLKLHFTEEDTFNDLFHRLIIDHIEPYLAKKGPVIVSRFPPSMAALARLDENGWADRFECYWNGLELANAFFEVTCPKVQKQRWKDEQSERKRLGTTPLPEDPALISALECGLPPTGGIALGVERLYMAMTGINDIDQLRLFSTKDLFLS